MLMFEPYVFDSQIYSIVPIEDRWVFNKLALSERLGYVCGPSGTNAPAGDFVIRPIMNLAGMGTGGVFQHSTPLVRGKPVNDFIPAAKYPGHFWCEEFGGDQQFVEYIGDVPVASTVGKLGRTIMRFTEVDPDTAPLLPAILRNYSHYGLAEFVGGNLIEFSPRHIATCARQSSIDNYRTLDPQYNPQSLKFGFTDMRRVPFEPDGWTWEEIEATRQPFTLAR